MTDDAVSLIQDVYRAAVDAVRPRAVIGQSIAVDAAGAVRIAGLEVNPARQPVYAIAIGKAAADMMSEVERILGDRLRAGIVVTKSHQPDTDLINSAVLLGAHPVPDERSLAAGEAVLRFATSIPAGALVVCLISGGGSALVEALRSGVNLDDLRSVTRDLLRAGASIHELNAVRARLSLLKAGGLLKALGDTDVVNLVISDVLGDDLATIASGPSVPRAVTVAADDVLERYGLTFALPAVESDDPATSGNPPRTYIVGNLSTAMDAAADTVRRRGLEVVVLSRSLTGEARHVAGTLASILADTSRGMTSLRRPLCLLAGGETTVTVHGTGTGGRNTEAALAAGLRLRGAGNLAIGFLSTDGDDAETGVAGAIVTGQTIDDDQARGAILALENNDSYTWLQRRGAAWGIGPTGTNVNDLVIGVAL